MKKFICFLGAVLICAGAAFAAPIKQANDKISVHAKEKIAPISPLFWGANFLFWIEDDKALADGKIAALLKDMPCTVLRYPGGTVADNFNWKTGTLENTAMFPYQSGEEETDFEEFMAVCKKIGAEPMLVVNTQSWAMKNDVAGGAKYAADWVRYCKEKGYKVKYWEIGNETYWNAIMTAKEYANLVNVYAKAMKAADPSILVGANGHWSVNFTGTKERTPKKYWDKLKKDLLATKTREETERIHEEHTAVKNKNHFEGDEKWWNDVADICGKNIDMISIHWYYMDKQIQNITPRINEVRELFKKKFPQKKFIVCLSEYNCNTSETAPRILGFAESIGRYLECGTEIATFWPTRISGMTQRSMINIKNGKPQYPYEILKLFERELKGDIVKCAYPKDCYAFASRKNNEMTLVISGRQLKSARNLNMDIKDFKFSKAEATVYTPVEKPLPNIKGAPLEVGVKGQSLNLEIPAESFVLIRLK